MQTKDNIYFDVIVIGAGFAGAVIAERAANALDKKVLLIEKRNHIGGNAYDHYDENGILIHKYGPHIFHTNQKHVWDYLSHFTEWYEYQHRVLGFIDGKEVPIPFNFDSLKALFPKEKYQKLEEKLVSHFGREVKVPILKLREVEDDELKELAEYVYEKVFLGYTTKQWGMTPEELNPSVTGRVPVHLSQDDRYFQDSYQGMPSHGYTKLFERMLTHPNIKIMLGADHRDIMEINCQNHEVFLLGQKFSGKVIYTGKIDELYDYEFGELPYRSLHFQHENISGERYQNSGTVNYPNDHDYTRITEFKYLTGQKHENTSIVREFPQAYEKDTPGKDVPYYPIPQPKNQELYQKYKQKAKEFEQLALVGRLAEYHYYDMHQAVAKALKVFGDAFG